MTITTGNFQDLVQLSQDTLYHLGPMFEVGDSIASTVTYGFSNTGGLLNLAASQTSNETLWLPNTNGTLIIGVNFSAGTTSNVLSNITFSNSNGISFGLNGSTMTASVNAGALAIEAIAAGTQTATSGTIVYSNSNNITFGMNNSSVITASYNFNISAGTTSNNLNAVTFSNSNGVSFGLNGSVVTASVLPNDVIVAGTQSFTGGTLSFANSNGITFGMSNSSIITASFNADILAIGAIGAGTQTATSGTVNFVNSNNITFGMSGTSQVTASYNFNISAGTTSNNLNAVTFSNSNNVSFGLNGSVVTASVTVASTQASVNFSAGTTSNNLSAITFSNSNGVSFGLNGSTMTASIATSLTAINVSAGTTSNNLSNIVFSNSNNVSFGLNGSTITASVTIASTQASINVSAGTTSNNVSALTFSNSNGIVFGLAGSVITAALGGISSWSNGRFATAQTGGQGTLFFQPIIVDYNLTATNLVWLQSVSTQASNSSGGFSVSIGLYTVSAGTKLVLASSGSSNITWTSGAALSSFSGINYQTMSLNSWSLVPAPYLVAWWISTQNGIGYSYYGDVQQPSISSGQQGQWLSNLMVNGYSNATTNALPATFAISDTAHYIRTGATAAEQIVFMLQGI